MRLALVTDAWAPQVNGVVRSLERIVAQLRANGDSVSVIAPNRFSTLPCPSYPEIRLAVPKLGSVGGQIESSGAEFVHIATEGPLGWIARRYCRKQKRGYTTSYHTRFPEYLSARLPIPLSWSYAYMRRFHNGGLGCMVATPSLAAELSGHGLRRLLLWPRGVDADLFRPRADMDLGFPRPVFLSVGRIAVEKNLAAFLELDLPGTKVVIGDGPARADLMRRFPQACFLGALEGEELAAAYAAADVFVFPSLTDTFGNVLLEALASGVPVAAFPVTGPRDVVDDPNVGALDRDLQKAALKALELSRAAARSYALRFSWEESTRIFRHNLLAANAATGSREGLAESAAKVLSQAR